MRSISAPLKAALVDGKRATLVKVTTKDNTIYGYTDHDLPLVVGGTTYVPSPGLQRISLNSSADASVSNQEFAAGWATPELSDDTERDLFAGKFDNAEIEVAFCAWNNLGLGSYVFQKGRLGVIQWTGDGFRADMQSQMRELQRNLSFVFTANCRHDLFDQFTGEKIGACTLNEASFTYTGEVSSVLTQKIKIRTSGLAQPDGHMTNGILTWTSGANNGLSYEVKKHEVAANTDITLFLPTFANIVAGDDFEVTAGCDKTLLTCKNKFNNVINFGGFPHIQAEVQYR